MEADLKTAQAFEKRSAGLTGAVNGAWQIADADGGDGVIAFCDRNQIWNQRRAQARDFWSDGPIESS